MKRKFLSLALVSALFAFAITGVVTAQTSEGALSEAEVSVTGDTTLTISVSGVAASHTCVGITAGVAVDECDVAWNGIADGYVEVVDYTGVGDTGHMVDLALDSSVWSYVGSDPDYGNVNVSASTGTANVLKYVTRGLFSRGNTYLNYVTKTGATCTPDTSVTGITSDGGTDIVLSKSYSLVHTNLNSCPAKWQYSGRYFFGVTGTNGLGQGSYINTGTWLLTDGDGI